MLKDKLTKSSSKNKIYFILCVIAFVIYACIDAFFFNYNFDKSIEEYKYSTIAKVVDFEHFSKGSSYTEYIYFYNNKTYTISDKIGNKNEDYVGKYFVVDISSKNPNHSKIYLDQEITDTSEIIKAGFKLK